MSLIDKMKNLFIGEDEEHEDEEDYYYEDDSEDMQEQDNNYSSSRRNSSNVESISKYSTRRQASNNVVNINTNVQMGVCMFTPSNLEDAADVVLQIKERNIVVVNLEALDDDLSQRISDFLCGASYSLDGNIQLISDRIMIIAPMNVEMSGELKDQLKASGIRFSNTRR